MWHKGLLYKLKKIGIGGNILNWFNSYLFNRLQRVVVKNKASDFGVIQAGVPQGSVLGPLLFLVYINDLVLNINSDIKLFADDTCLYIDFVHQNDAETILNDDLKTIKEWADTWIVSFSPNKTKTLTCSLKKNETSMNLYFGENRLEKTLCHKHLGLIFNQTLSWSNHVSALLTGVKSMAGLLKHLKHIVDRKSLEQFYFTFIRPKLEYSSIVWDNCNKSDCKDLEDFQLDIARTVTGAKRGTSHAAIYQETGWPKLSERRTFAKLKTFINMTEGKAPQYLCSLIPSKMGDARPTSRFANNFTLYKCRTELFKNTFIPSTISLYNGLDLSERNITALKEKIKFVPNRLFNYGERITNIICSQLRMKCSNLNGHLYLLHVIDSPACACGHDMEDCSHYLLHCPLFQSMRTTMLNEIGNVMGAEVVSTDSLLHGFSNKSAADNLLVMKSLHKYIVATARFN